MACGGIFICISLSEEKGFFTQKENCNGKAYFYILKNVA